MHVDALVERLRARWEPLSETDRHTLAARTIDRCVRAVAPDIDPITDEASMLRAELVLSRLLKASLDPQREAAVHALLMSFELLKGELLLDEAAYMTVTVSRHLYGDDSLVRLLEADLAARAPAGR